MHVSLVWGIEGIKLKNLKRKAADCPCLSIKSHHLSRCSHCPFMFYIFSHQTVSSFHPSPCPPVLSHQHWKAEVGAVCEQRAAWTHTHLFLPACLCWHFYPPLPSLPFIHPLLLLTSDPSPRWLQLFSVYFWSIFCSAACVCMFFGYNSSKV